MTDENPYTDAYSERGLKDKLTGYARTAGKDVVEKVLLLYYALQRSDTPAWAKATIIGALGYFITPLDAITDFAPLVGYSDDLGVLALALATVAGQIDEGVRQKAAAKLQAWFGTTATVSDAGEDTVKGTDKDTGTG